jgi:hypothetical protein
VPLVTEHQISTVASKDQYWRLTEYAHRLADLIRRRVCASSMICTSQENRGIAWLELSWDGLVVVRTSIVPPPVTARDHNRGSILLGRLHRGCHTADQHRLMPRSDMVIDLVSVQALLPRAWIDLEPDRA